MLLWIKKHRKTDFFSALRWSKNSTISDDDRRGHDQRGSVQDDAEVQVCADGAEPPPPEQDGEPQEQDDEPQEQDDAPLPEPAAEAEQLLPARAAAEAEPRPREPEPPQPG